MSSSAVSNPKSVAVAAVPLWINGEKCPSHSSRHGVVTNPATGDVIRTVPP
jgi:hypothetical protein